MTNRMLKCDCHICEPTEDQVNIETYLMCEACHDAILHIDKASKNAKAWVDKQTTDGGYITDGSGAAQICGSRCDCCGTTSKNNRRQVLVLVETNV